MTGINFGKNQTTVAVLGAGELGKGAVLSLKRLGVRVVACDTYPDAPAMQVADESRVFDMGNRDLLLEFLREVRPTYTFAEIEAISLEAVKTAEKEGLEILPNAEAVGITMNRIALRRFAAEKLKLPTSDYRYAETHKEYLEAVKQIDIPCVVKPTMSFSGKGQTVVKSESDVARAWERVADARGSSDGVVVEKFVKFDYELTMLVARNSWETVVCPPIGHRQEDGDYRESWQPHRWSSKVEAQAKKIAQTVTDGLGGRGVFGVELFVLPDETVLFNEVSPRPHDTGMVTEITQNLSEFDLHARCILDLPIGGLELHRAGASYAVLERADSLDLTGFGFMDVAKALSEPGTDLRIFGKKSLRTSLRRLGVILATADSVEDAKEKTKRVRERLGFVQNLSEEV